MVRRPPPSRPEKPAPARLTAGDGPSPIGRLRSTSSTAPRNPRRQWSWRCSGGARTRTPPAPYARRRRVLGSAAGRGVGPGRQGRWWREQPGPDSTVGSVVGVDRTGCSSCSRRARRPPVSCCGPSSVTGPTSLTESSPWTWRMSPRDVRAVELEDFVDALSARARYRVVFELSAQFPQARFDPLWTGRTGAQLAAGQGARPRVRPALGTTSSPGQQDATGRGSPPSPHAAGRARTGNSSMSVPRRSSCSSRHSW
jgi:hypothetical protein